MKDFYTLTKRGRAFRLRKMALAALERYDLDVARVRLLTNDMNGIFRVDTAGGDKVFPFQEPVVIFDDAYRHVLPPARREIFQQVADRVQAVLDRLNANSDRMGVIHGDLHHWNTKVYRGQISALDFEDLMWGYEDPSPDYRTAAPEYFERWEKRLQAFLNSSF